jgi:hypothetical protein
VGDDGEKRAEPDEARAQAIIAPNDSVEYWFRYGGCWCSMFGVVDRVDVSFVVCRWPDGSMSRLVRVDHSVRQIGRYEIRFWEIVER